MYSPDGLSEVMSKHVNARIVVYTMSRKNCQSYLQNTVVSFSGHTVMMACIIILLSSL